MSDRVKVKVLRMHFGDQGTKVEGETYETSKAHAAQLTNLKLVEIVGEAKGEPAPENKAEPGAPENKSGGTPAPAPTASPAPTTAEAPATPAKKPARKRAPKA